MTKLDSRAAGHVCAVATLSLCALNGCDDNDTQRGNPDQLVGFELSAAELPDSPTNAYADRAEAAALGQRLFFERRMSSDGSVACANCHDSGPRILRLDASLSLRGGGVFGGLRASAPWGFVRLGPRFWTSTSQKLLEPQPSYSRAELDVSDGLRSKYPSLDGELGFAIPLPVGSIATVITAYGLLGVQHGYDVFEESLRCIVTPPFVGRARVTYLAPIGDPATFRIGGLVEAVYNPGREYVNIRTGPAVTVALTHHVEALASIALSVFNKDEIGVSGADLGQIGFRYRWATGDLWPEFP